MEELARHSQFQNDFYWEFKSGRNTKFCSYQLLYLWKTENGKDGERIFFKVLWLIKNVFLSHMHTLHQSSLVFTQESKDFDSSQLYFSVWILFYCCSA